MSNKTILVDAWNTFVNETGVNKQMQTLLDSYDNVKIIVTNANENERIKLGIVNMPYEVFSLSHSPNKTDPLYFVKFLETYKLKANELLYFEHNEEAVKSAKSMGINTLWLPIESSLETLKLFLDSNL